MSEAPLGRATVVVDLGFGDAGKGSIVDYLVRQAETPPTVVRFNGGPQAAHRVVERTWKVSGGRTHVFAQFGAGSFVKGVRTHLARGMLVNPANLMVEYLALRKIGVRDALARLTVDPNCVVIAPWQIAANQAIEAARGDRRHGSCGQGVGEARSDELADVALRAGECRSRATLLVNLGRIRDRNAAKLDDLGITKDEALFSYAFIQETADALRDPRWLGRIAEADALERYAAEGPLVFEGAQGALLDEKYGFHPYTTWTDTTARGAHDLLDEIGLRDEATTMGLLRAYATRHGAGPLPTEDETLTAALPDPENGEGRWQGRWRVGYLDFVLLRYALSFSPVDSLALTCVDRLRDLRLYKAAGAYDNAAGIVPVFNGYDPIEHGERLTAILEEAKPIYVAAPTSGLELAGAVELVSEKSVSLISYGPTYMEKAPLVPAWA